MTRDEILAMPAGREMDYLVAEKVLELSILKDGSGILLPVDIQVKPYSTDIAAAWEVVEKFDGYNLEKAKDYEPGCSFGYSDDSWALAETAPLAICRAALLALMEKDAL